MHTLKHIPFWKTRQFRLAFFAGCLGAVTFLLIYGFTPLNVTNDSWITSGYVEKDIIQHYTGWLFYRDSPISFPLGIASGINYPHGIAVTYSDSVPLFALFFRFFEAFLPETFQYFGLFTLLCFILQGVSAALLLSLFIDSHFAVIVASELFILSPIMIERAFRHTALAAQFLILFALFFYFRNQREGRKSRAGYLVLLGFATTIHPYFLPMIFAVFLADLVQHAVQAKTFWRDFGALCAGFGVVLAVGYCIGIFESKSSGGATGFGYFCMNFNSLFNPLSLPQTVWSRVLPVRAQGYGTYDGFNYLGISILAASVPLGIFWLIKNAKNNLIPFIKRHFALLLVCMCLTIFSFSHIWTWGDLQFFEWPIPAKLVELCSMFRSSGRLFWPMYYLIFLCVTVLCTRVFPRKKMAGTALLACLLVVQTVDISPALIRRGSVFKEVAPSATSDGLTFDNPMQDVLWQESAGKYAHMQTLDTATLAPLYLALYAVQNGMTTSDPFTARYDAVQQQTDIDAAITALRAGNIAPDTLYLTSQEALANELIQALGTKATMKFVDSLWYVILPA